MFCVCALFYGGHADLCGMLLDSLIHYGDLRYVDGYRFGLNEASPATRELVFRFCEQREQACRVYEPARNVGKYSLMSQMFHDPEAPITSPAIMWFDDDSRLNGESMDVFKRAANLLSNGSDMLGDIWQKGFEGKQREWIQSRPWYTGVPWAKNKKSRDCFRFATGGWWAIKTEIIRRWGWPDPELRHNGGDVSLGELLRQQRLILTSFKKGLWINANKTGGYSNAPRRGLTEAPAGKHWAPGQSPDLSHYEYDLKVYTFGQSAKATDNDT